MTAIPGRRRAALAIAALLLAALLFRRELAAALVVRGDTLLRGGDRDGALVRYARALALDPDSGVAADRLAFWLLLRRGAGDAARAYDVAGRALQRGADVRLLVDRGLAAAQLGRLEDAHDAFARAGRDARDPRYAYLAARVALRAGDRVAARISVHAALADDPAFAPARALAGKLR